MAAASASGVGSVDGGLILPDSMSSRRTAALVNPRRSPDSISRGMAPPGPRTGNKPRPLAATGGHHGHSTRFASRNVGPASLAAPLFHIAQAAFLLGDMEKARRSIHEAYSIDCAVYGRAHPETAKDRDLTRWIGVTEPQ